MLTECQCRTQTVWYGNEASVGGGGGGGGEGWLVSSMLLKLPKKNIKVGEKVYRASISHHHFLGQ